MDTLALGLALVGFLVTLILLALVAIGVWLAVGAVIVGGRSYWRMAALESELRAQLGPDARFWSSRWLKRLRIELPLEHGRRAEVSFFPGAFRYYARFELPVSTAARVSMRRRRFGPGQPESAAGLRLWGLPFVFATLDREKVEHAFAKNPGLRDDLVAAFGDLRLDSLMLWDGRLTATAPLGRVKIESFRPLLEHLARIARAFEPVPLQVRVFHGERRAFVGERGPRCAYCHDGITGDEPDLVACGKCQTVLHESCWQDLGRCPVLGCDGKEPERPRETVAARTRIEP